MINRSYQLFKDACATTGTSCQMTLPVDLNFVLGLFTVEARFLSGLASDFDLSLSAEGGLSILI